MGCMNSRYDNKYIFKTLSNDIIKNKELKILWFEGTLNPKTTEELYELFGHLGFKIPNGSIYGFSPNISYCKNPDDIFNGDYYGKICNNDLMFEKIRNKKKFKIYTLSTFINENTYNFIKSWDVSPLNYKNITNITYGIKKIPYTDWGYHYDENENVANCVTILDYLQSKFDNKILDTQNGIISQFTKEYGKFATIEQNIE